jgi:phage terminase large subunit
MKQSLIDKLYTNRQWEIAQDIKVKKPRHVILHGPVRSGKTRLAIMYWQAIVSKAKNSLFIMTGQTISSLKRNVLDEITKLFGIDTHLNINNEFKMYGNMVACFGSDKSDSYKSMRGLTSSGWYANEVILSHQNSVLEAFARCSGTGARIIWETNPDKPTHYIKTNYIDNAGKQFEDGSYNILEYNIDLESNDRLDKTYVESLKASIPQGTLYDRLILGKWRATELGIFSNFDIKKHAPEKHKIHDTFYGIDWGYNHPTAFVKVMIVDGEPWIEGCFCRSHLLTDDIVDLVKSYVDNPSHPIYCDTAEPDKIQALRNAGLNAFNAKKDVLPGIYEMQRHKIHLLDSDHNLIRQFENYEFRKNAMGEVTEEPVKIDDDYPDAARYAIYTHGIRGPEVVEYTADIYDYTEDFIV